MLEMRRGQENRHFQMSKSIFTDMKASSAAGHLEPHVGLVKQAQVRRLPQFRIGSSQRRPLHRPPHRPSPISLAHWGHAGEPKDALLDPAHSMCLAALSVNQRRHAHRDDKLHRFRKRTPQGIMLSVLERQSE
jgi:hypothetical protein